MILNIGYSPGPSVYSRPGRGRRRTNGPGKEIASSTTGTTGKRSNAADNRGDQAIFLSFRKRALSSRYGMSISAK